MDDNHDSIETVFCEIEDDIYVHKVTPFINPYLHSEGGRTTIGDLKEHLPSNPNGAIIFSVLGSEKTLTDYIEKEFNRRIKIRFWHVNEVVVSEFYSPNTSKANAIQKVCDYYNIPQDKVIAIGDGHNDIEMIEYAKYGVAMENSHPDLLKVAKYKTKSVKEHGVYYFLKHFKKLI
jgi:hydroxymethylpyrimidine pyrophosphatase-like HAD family hydrolase